MICGKRGKITDAMIKKISERAVSSPYGNLTGDYGIKNVTNTDVNMLVSIDPINNKILLTSIPRDYYVNLPSFGTNAYDKLTHAGYYGIEESVKTVENLLDVDINYYIKLNFTSLTKTVDTIGGITVDSKYSFTSQDGYKYTRGKN